MRLFAGFLPDERTLSCKAERAAITHEPGSQDQRAALALHGLLVSLSRRHATVYLVLTSCSGRLRLSGAQRRSTRKADAI